MTKKQKMCSRKCTADAKRDKIILGDAGATQLVFLRAYVSYACRRKTEVYQLITF